MKLLSIYLYTCRCHREILLWYEIVINIPIYLQVHQGSMRVVWNCYQCTYILADATGKYYCCMKLLSINLYTCRCHGEDYYCGMKLLSIYLYTCRCHREVLEWYEFVMNLPLYLQMPQGSITVVWNCFQFTYILSGATGTYYCGMKLLSIFTYTLAGATEKYYCGMKLLSIMNIPIYLQLPQGSFTVVWNCYKLTYILAGATWTYYCGMKLLLSYPYTCRCHREVLLWYEIVINLPIYLQVPHGSITVV